MKFGNILRYRCAIHQRFDSISSLLNFNTNRIFAVRGFCECFLRKFILFFYVNFHLRLVGLIKKTLKALLQVDFFQILLLNHQVYPYSF